MATAKKTPSGKWQIQACRTVDGKKQRKLFTADTKKEAEYLSAQWLNESAEIVEEFSVKEAFDKYIASKESVLSPNTVHAYKMMAENYLLSIHKVKLSALTEEKIQISINELAAEKSPKTVRNAYGMLTATLRMFRPSFTPHITLPQKEKTDIVIPTKKEMKRLLDYAKGRNIYLPILLAAFCGLRAGEICALNYEDFNGGKITISKSMAHDDELGWVEKPPKTFSGYRVVDCPPMIKNAVEGKNGRIVEYTPDGLRIVFKKTLKAAKVKDFRFHDLRHFFVSELFDMNVPEKYIIAQVGHSSASITKKVYDHISNQKRTEYSSKISNHFNTFLEKSASKSASKKRK